MTDVDVVKIELTIGVPGESDVVLEELQGVADQLGTDLAGAVVLVLGMGLGRMQMSGMTVRVTPVGEGFRRRGTSGPPYCSDCLDECIRAGYCVARAEDEEVACAYESRKR